MPKVDSWKADVNVFEFFIPFLNSYLKFLKENDFEKNAGNKDTDVIPLIKQQLENDFNGNGRKLFSQILECKKFEKQHPLKIYLSSYTSEWSVRLYGNSISLIPYGTLRRRLSVQVWEIFCTEE